MQEQQTSIASQAFAMVTLPYQPPVSKLLSYGSCDGQNASEWPNYVEALALTADHIPALIELVQDATFWQFWDETQTEDDLPELDPEVDPFSAPIHAWRALGQLKATAAVPALIQVLVQRDIDWCWEELPEVFGLIGPAAIAPLQAAIADPDIPDGPKFSLSDGIAKIAELHPDSRDECIQALTACLATPGQNSPDVNGSICCNLLDLNAVESAPAIKAGYANGSINPRFAGTWATVQVELGLKPREAFDPQDFELPYDPKLAKIREYLDQLERAKKPTAWELGLPIDRHVFDQDAPPDFKALVRSPKSESTTTGFGSKAKSGKKKKKKKR